MTVLHFFVLRNLRGVGEVVYITFFVIAEFCFSVSRKSKYGVDVFF